MAAGIATLRLLGEPGVYEQLEARGAQLEAGILANAKEFGIPLTINRVGSMVCPFFTEGPVTNYDSAKSADLARFNTYFSGMLDAGVSLPPSQFEGMFISLAHTEEHIAQTIAANREVFKTL
jgi:glutamate-1-semialdehyde 2,1-aminomutase